MSKLTKYLFSLICCLLPLLSCTKDEEKREQETATVSYRIPFYDIEMKSVDDGASISHVWYAVYHKDGTLFYICEKPEPIFNGYAICPVTMVLDQAYKVVFLGIHYDKEMTPAYVIDADAATVSYPDTPTVNSGTADLFYACDEIEKFSGAVTDNLKLYRIVSQINFASAYSDWNAQEQKPVSGSLVLRNVPCAFSLTSGTVSDETVETVTYTRENLMQNETLTVESQEYKRLLTAWAFAPADQSQVSYDLMLWNEGSAECDYLLSRQDPLAANGQTNITGNILTVSKK